MAAASLNMEKGEVSLQFLIGPKPKLIVTKRHLSTFETTCEKRFV